MYSQNHISRICIVVFFHLEFHSLTFVGHFLYRRPLVCFNQLDQRTLSFITGPLATQVLTLPTPIHLHKTFLVTFRRVQISWLPPVQVQ